MNLMLYICIVKIKIMKTLKLKYFCNAGYTEEVVYLELPDNLTENEEEDWIQKDFLTWLDNNEQIGWEIIC